MANRQLLNSRLFHEIFSNHLICDKIINLLDNETDVHSLMNVLIQDTPYGVNATDGFRYIFQSNGNNNNRNSNNGNESSSSNRNHRIYNHRNNAENAIDDDGDADNNETSDITCDTDDDTMKSSTRDAALRVFGDVARFLLNGLNIDPTWMVFRCTGGDALNIIANPTYRPNDCCCLELLRDRYDVPENTDAASPYHLINVDGKLCNVALLQLTAYFDIGILRRMNDDLMSFSENRLYNVQTGRANTIIMSFDSKSYRYKPSSTADFEAAAATVPDDDEHDETTYYLLKIVENYNSYTYPAAVLGIDSKHTGLPQWTFQCVTDIFGYLSEETQSINCTDDERYRLSVMQRTCCSNHMLENHDEWYPIDTRTRWKLNTLKYQFNMCHNFDIMYDEIGSLLPNNVRAYRLHASGSVKKLASRANRILLQQHVMLASSVHVGGFVARVLFRMRKLQGNHFVDFVPSLDQKLLVPLEVSPYGWKRLHELRYLWSSEHGSGGGGGPMKLLKPMSHNEILDWYYPCLQANQHLTRPAVDFFENLKFAARFLMDYLDFGRFDTVRIGGAHMNYLRSMCEDTARNVKNSNCWACQFFDYRSTLMENFQPIRLSSTRTTNLHEMDDEIDAIVNDEWTLFANRLCPNGTTECPKHLHRGFSCRQQKIIQPLYAIDVKIDVDTTTLLRHLSTIADKRVMSVGRGSIDAGSSSQSTIIVVCRYETTSPSTMVAILVRDLRQESTPTQKYYADIQKCNLTDEVYANIVATNPRRIYMMPNVNSCDGSFEPYDLTVYRVDNEQAHKQIINCRACCERHASPLERQLTYRAEVVGMYDFTRATHCSFNCEQSNELRRALNMAYRNHVTTLDKMHNLIDMFTYVQEHYRNVSDVIFRFAYRTIAHTFSRKMEIIPFHRHSRSSKRAYRWLIPDLVGEWQVLQALATTSASSSSSSVSSSRRDTARKSDHHRTST